MFSNIGFHNVEFEITIKLKKIYLGEACFSHRNNFLECSMGKNCLLPGKKTPDNQLPFFPQNYLLYDSCGKNFCSNIKQNFKK